MSIVQNAIAPVHLPGDVYRYLVGKIRGDLPALAEPDPTAGDITGTLACALRALTETRTGRGGDGPERASREPKTIQEAYKETYRTLLRYGNATDVMAVAPIWNRLANASKSELHTIMIQEFQRVCMARGLSTDIYTPVVTAGLKQMIVGMQFVGHGVDNLRTGWGASHSKLPTPVAPTTIERRLMRRSVTNWLKASKMLVWRTTKLSASRRGSNSLETLRRCASR